VRRDQLKEIHSAIQQGDSGALRKIADQMERTEDRMFLFLLADLVDRQREQENRPSE